MEPVVATAQGKLRGTQEEGVFIFRGIPYAAAPTGNLRWRAPQPPQRWEGTRDAVEFGPICPQNASPLANMWGREELPQDEDCLTLNVWSPELGQAGRPVMVWIHGGAFQTGSGRTPWYDGRRFAQNDVVCVTINYRLGPLGFLQLREIFGDDFASNCGIADQVAALSWVRENIAAFGGDPANVTVFGESAGGGSIGTLLSSPHARGLFAKAIPQSGAAHWAHAPEVAAQVAKRFAEEAGVVPGDADALREAPAERLLEAAARIVAQGTQDPTGLYGEEFAGAGMPFQPAIDGEVVPGLPIEEISSGAAADVRVLVGTTAEEWKLFTAFLPEQPAGRARAPRPLRNLLARAGKSAEELLSAYEQDRPSELEVRNAIETDRMFRIPAIRLAEAQVRNGTPVHMYIFAWPTPVFDGKLGACHAIEIPFVFNNLDARGIKAFCGPNPPQELADACHAAWVRFAHTGEPGHDGLPSWPAYDLERRATMVFDEECRVENDPGAAERKLWEGVL